MREYYETHTNNVLIHILMGVNSSNCQWSPLSMDDDSPFTVECIPVFLENKITF